MAILTDLREELADTLTAAGLDAFDYIPERVNPPVCVIAAGTPYLTELFDKKTFNHDYQVRMEVTLIAGRATNETATAELDDLIVATLTSLTDWEVEVSQPFQLETNGAIYLAAKASITTSITIN